MKERIADFLIRWFTGGILYFYLEILFRGYSHYSMIICGGLCFVLVGSVGQYIIEKDLNNILKVIIIMLAGAIIISLLELITGLIVNIKFDMNVWDYSDMPYNYNGQICLAFTGIWAGISLVCVYINYLMRFFIFQNIKKEEK